jgi:hypothetical protein
MMTSLKWALASPSLLLGGTLVFTGFLLSRAGTLGETILVQCHFNKCRRGDHISCCHACWHDGADNTPSRFCALDQSDLPRSKRSGEQKRTPSKGKVILKLSQKI